MAIALPIPGLGQVTILVAEGDLVTFECPQINDQADSLLQLRPGSLVRVTCPSGGQVLCVYLTNFADLNLINIIEQILDLSIENVVPETEITTIIASGVEE
ncbi:hypothetical protein MM326_02150 [Alkalihalobacillus sp. LMS6]|uniref:hypothetical protein n=1 Tax=Bacillaceae TaxID=186817 RepID=UPI000C08D984|nr:MULTISPECIES: hypothetical protein [Bacillaceae]UTR06854.1 hypothetical protein MM326_02150 [Alkalihalobacillus sp. LMS6]